jgi:Holliday junction resolvase RusA-like endonuclease
MGDEIRTMGAEIAAGFIPGTPKGQPRGRHVRGRVVSWAAAGRPVVLWRARVERELRLAVGRLEGALEPVVGGGPVSLAVSLKFVFPTVDAKRRGTPHLSKPDTDNLAKLWLDVAVGVGLLMGQDDACVAGLESFKEWGTLGGCAWTLRRLANPNGAPKLGAGPAEPARWWDAP